MRQDSAVATAAQWVEGARPRTLPAAVAPVAAGTGAAAASSVKRAAFTAFAVAAVAGLVLVVASQAWLLLIAGVASVVAAWYYTGGRNPYGYRGLGEVFVFVFFGLVAVLGTTYSQAGRLTWPAVAGAVGVGALACALLVANNLRDIPTDAASGKRTLAVRLGDARTRALYLGLLTVTLALVVVIALAHPGAVAALASAALMVPAVRRIRSGATGLALIPVLRDTGRAELVYGVLLGLGLALT